MTRSQKAGLDAASRPLLSPESFREVMAGVPAPVTVLTAHRDGQPHGTTVSSFSSLSLDPPMIFAALSTTSELLGIIKQSRRFGVNVLSSDQSRMAVAFASKGPDKFAAVPFEMQDGSPRITGVTGWLACELTDLLDGGDHLIVVGTVVTAERLTGTPLTYMGRTFGTHAALGVAT
jgi:flavin reductase (DIM6/NTAB) family NADH-FMN oxidoreductase RutF